MQVEPVTLRIGSAVRWCARCGEDVWPGEKCMACVCAEAVAPANAVLRAGEFEVAH